MSAHIDALNDEPTVEIDGKRGVLRHCPVCGTAYAAERYWLRQGRAKYCSHACYAEDKRRRDVEAYFWERVHKTDTCWLWTGTLSHGYGVLGLRALRPLPFAHRYSYELHNGPISDGMVICHTCDNPRCVNPAHLFVGTQADNMTDAASKGRMRKGRKHHAAKLKAGDIPVILQLREQGLSYPKIAKRFNVDQQTIGNVCRGKAWKHVPRD